MEVAASRCGPTRVSGPENDCSTRQAEALRERNFNDVDL